MKFIKKVLIHCVCACMSVSVTLSANVTWKIIDDKVSKIKIKLHAFFVFGRPSRMEAFFVEEFVLHWPLLTLIIFIQTVLYILNIEIGQRILKRWIFSGIEILLTNNGEKNLIRILSIFLWNEWNMKKTYYAIHSIIKWRRFFMRISKG